MMEIKSLPYAADSFILLHVCLYFNGPRDMSTTVDVNDLHEDVVKVNRNL